MRFALPNRVPELVRQPRASGPAPRFQGLTDIEIHQVVNAGKRKVFYRGAQVFAQGSPQNGIYLVESGRIRVTAVVDVALLDLA